METNQETRSPLAPPDESERPRRLGPAVGIYGLAVWIATALLALVVMGRSDHAQDASERLGTVLALAVAYGILFLAFLPSLVCHIRRTSWFMWLPIQVGVLILLFIALAGWIVVDLLLSPGFPFGG